MAGRKTKRTPDVERKIIEALNAGTTRRAACAYAGIHQDTFYVWMNRHPEFADAVIRAEASCEVSAIISLRQGWMSGDWRAAVEWLKRRQPQEWGDAARIEIVNSVRELARAAGADEDAAVAEAEAYLRETRRARAKS